MNVVRPGLLSSVVYAFDARKIWLDLKRDLIQEIDLECFIYTNRFTLYDEAQ